MPPVSVTIFMSDVGDYLLGDDGIPANNFSQITFPNGTPVSFEHPTDDLFAAPSAAGINLTVQLVDSFGTSRITLGSLTDPLARLETLRIGAMETAAGVVLAANSKIEEFGADAAPDILAASVAMLAGTGIGTQGPIELQVGILEAQTTTGGIDLRNTGTMAIGGLSGDLGGLRVVTSGSVKLVNTGSIILSDETNPETVKSGSSNGNVTLTALGVSSDILSNIDQDSISAPRGKITLEAGRDIGFGLIGANFDNDVRANDALRIVAGRDFLLDGFADMASDDFGQGAGEGVTIIAGRNISLLSVAGTDASILANGSAGADVRLTTGFGGTLSLDVPTANQFFTIRSFSGDVLVEADRVVFLDPGSNIAAQMGTIAIRTRTEGWDIDLGATDDADPGVMQLDDAEMDRMFSPNLVIGGEDTGDVTVVGNISPLNVTSLTLRSGTRIQINAVAVTGNTLTLRSGGDIVIVPGAAFGLAGPIIGFVDDDGADGGVGGRALVGAFLAEAVNFTGGGDKDTLQGGAAGDTLDGGDGIDRLVGRNGNDTYVATAGDIIVEALGEGEDTVQTAINYFLGSDLENLTLTGGGDRTGVGNELDNRINGNSGDNALAGNDGGDTINGFGGADSINGGAQKDRLNGGNGQDLINGGGGSDKLEGGPDADTFRFDTAPHTIQNNDDIQDFVIADDTIELENAVFTSIAITGALANGNFRSGAAATDGNDFIIYNAATGEIFYDADGNGAGGAIQFASVTAGLALTRFDFFVT